MLRTTFISTLCFLLLSASGISQQVWPVKLQKDYSKSYPVGTETVALLNKYGQMKIETWDRNEVKVEAKISVSAQSNEYANKMLERINVMDEKKTDRIEFRTELGDRNNGWSDDNGGHEMRIDWTVHVPANAKLQAENDFGALTIGDYRGEASLLCKYGTLTAGKLANCKEIVSEYGKAVIESVSDSKLMFRYTRVDIGKLAGTIKAELQYCSSLDLAIDNSLKQLDLKSNYTSVYLLVPKDFSADYDISTTNARVSSKNELPIKEELKEQAAVVRQVAYTSNHHYVGSIGKAGGTQLLIRSNSGNIRIL
jgi:hypothetical protein